MVRAENSGSISEDAFVDGDSLIEKTGLLVCVRDVISRRQSVGVVRAENSGSIQKYLFIEIKSFFYLS